MVFAYLTATHRAPAPRSPTPWASERRKEHHELLWGQCSLALAFLEKSIEKLQVKLVPYPGFAPLDGNTRVGDRLCCVDGKLQRDALARAAHAERDQILERMAIGGITESVRVSESEYRTL